MSEQVQYEDGSWSREMVVAEAEQRGREDNADHDMMCYVHGSEALRARLAEAWNEGYASGHTDGIDYACNPDAPAGQPNNPYCA